MEMPQPKESLNPFFFYQICILIISSTKLKSHENPKIHSPGGGGCSILGSNHCRSLGILPFGGKTARVRREASNKEINKISCVEGGGMRATGGTNEGQSRRQMSSVPLFFPTPGKDRKSFCLKREPGLCYLASPSYTSALPSTEPSRPTKPSRKSRFFVHKRNDCSLSLSQLTSYSSSNNHIFLHLSLVDQSAIGSSATRVEKNPNK